MPSKGILDHHEPAAQTYPGSRERLPRERMNLFEHVAVAFSMVLSFGVVRLLDGLRPALVPGRRYWVHALWLVQKLLNHAFY